MRLLLLGQAVALVLFTLIIPIEVIYAKESLGTTSAGYGILLASWGAGIFVGSLLYLRIKNRSRVAARRRPRRSRSPSPTSASPSPARCSSPA